jgi:hypothetical protein
MTTASRYSDEATPKQHLAIINCLCYKLGEPHTHPPMDKIAAYLNTHFNLNLDAELEPLTKQEASRIISSLIN